MFRETFGEALRFFRDHSFRLLAIVMLVTVPVTVATTYMEDALGLPLSFSICLSMVMETLCLGTLIVAMSSAWSGEGIRIGSAFGQAAKKWIPLFFGMWLTYIAVLFGMLLLIVPGLYLLARWAFVPFLITLEDISPLNTFGESHRRTQRYISSLLGVNVLFLAAIFALTLATYLPAAFILPGLDSHPVVNYLFAIAESIVWCVWVCTFFIFYKREEAARATPETPPPLPPEAGDVIP